jgi:hypothetical protein
MIPELISVGAPWLVLPPGIHPASLDDIGSRFANTTARKHLFSGLVEGVANFKAAGCARLFLNGGFTGENPNPSDYDVCWDPVGLNTKELDPVFLDFSDKRRSQKEKYGGEYFPMTARATQQEFYFDYFQKDKFTGKPKGIIQIL